MALSCPLAGLPAVSHKKMAYVNHIINYKESLIDEACSVKIAEYWSS